MVKKILSIILGLILTVALSACSKNKTDVNSSESSDAFQAESMDASNVEETGSFAMTETEEFGASSTIDNQDSIESKPAKPDNNTNANSTSLMTNIKPEETSKPNSNNEPTEAPKPEQQSEPTSTTHTHTYSAATCTTPAKCSCGATQGSALGHKWINATCTTPKTCSVCKITEGTVAEHTYNDGVCTVCGKSDPSIPIYTDVVIIKDTQTLSDQTIDKDVYITSTGNATFENVTVNGNVYCYGQLTMSGCKAIGIYAYKYGSMFSCAAFDGTHGKVSGGVKCDTLYIKDDALDHAFNKWGKK